ncbi:MAG: hypothetical protein PHV34_02965 [Verrucomicrobiae bacterium]|nr:hypothetical protein [Verrucomicrobiae bacterium]
MRWPFFSFLNRFPRIWKLAIAGWVVCLGVGHLRAEEEQIRVKRVGRDLVEVSRQNAARPADVDAEPELGIRVVSRNEPAMPAREGGGSLEIEAEDFSGKSPLQSTTRSSRQNRNEEADGYAPSPRVDVMSREPGASRWKPSLNGGEMQSAALPAVAGRRVEMVLRELQLLRKAARQAGGDLSVSIKPEGIVTEDLLAPLLRMGCFRLSAQPDGAVRVESLRTNLSAGELGDEVQRLERRRRMLLEQILMLEKNAAGRRPGETRSIFDSKPLP